MMDGLDGGRRRKRQRRETQYNHTDGWDIDTQSGSNEQSEDTSRTGYPSSSDLNNGYPISTEPSSQKAPNIVANDSARTDQSDETHHNEDRKPAAVSASCSEPANVCFGMLARLPIRSLNKIRLESLACTRLTCGLDLTTDPIGVTLEDGCHVALLDQQCSNLIKVLAAEHSLETQCVLLITSPSDGSKTIPKSRKWKSACSSEVALHTVLYGPQDLAEPLGHLLSACGIYLQLPIYSDRNVIYHNPQSLSSPGDIVRVTGNLQPFRSNVQVLEDDLDPSTALESEVVYVETSPPTAVVSSTLYSHQRQALTFMQAREKGWDFQSDAHDLWKVIDSNEGDRYVDMVSNAIQDTPPDQFRGGMLADCMGLGKTLSMISLFASDKADDVLEGSISNGPNLLIVPLSLLQTWIDEITLHTEPGTMSIWKYHGLGCSINPEALLNYDIVITTYELVASHWRRQPRLASILFSTHWRRIILDEAHEIRKSSTAKAKAVCALSAHARWAMTGTPLHNGLQDLASLMYFLRVYPSMGIKELRAFLKKTATNARTRDLISPICLRRSKNVVRLPQRSDRVHTVSFSSADDELYRTTKLTTMNRHCNELMEQNQRAYSSVLAEINTLRQLCNLGEHYTRKQREQKGAGRSTFNLRAIEQTFEELLTAGMAQCCKCKQEITLQEGNDQLQQSSEKYTLPSMTVCGSLLCAKCATGNIASDSLIKCICDNKKPCEYIQIPSPVSDDSAINDISIMELPAKIQALRSDLLAVDDGDRSIVFSFWTSTLDIVQLALRDSKLRCVRVDGTMSHSKRREAFDSFKNDPKTRVILISLGCGSTGLNLTVANHVFLMEPQWNPMIEAQALDRVYRIGQTKEVTTVRYLVEGTIEQVIRAQQTKKKQLAEHVLAPSRRSRDWIRRMRELLASAGDP